MKKLAIKKGKRSFYNMNRIGDIKILGNTLDFCLLVSASLYFNSPSTLILPSPPIVFHALVGSITQRFLWLFSFLAKNVKRFAL